MTLSEQAQKSLGNWLESMKWSYWVTGTTPYELTLKSARRAMEGVSKYIDIPHRIFWVAEPFDCKEGFHCHYIIFFDMPVQTKLFDMTWHIVLQSWRKSTGCKSARIHATKYRKNGGVTKYVAKYITKNLSDYDIIDKLAQKKL